MPTLDAALLLLQYSSSLGVPDSVYARFNFVSETCHPAPYYLNSDKPFLTLRERYRNPEREFEPGSLSECLLEFNTHSKPLSHHGRFNRTYYNLLNIIHKMLTPKVTKTSRLLPKKSKYLISALKT